jgi:hypothetical protein
MFRRRRERSCRMFGGIVSSRSVHGGTGNRGLDDLAGQQRPRVRAATKPMPLMMLIFA